MDSSEHCVHKTEKCFSEKPDSPGVAMRHVDGKLMKSSSSKVKCHTSNEKKKLGGKGGKKVSLCNNFLPNSPGINQKQGMPKTKVTKCIQLLKSHKVQKSQSSNSSEHCIHNKDLDPEQCFTEKPDSPGVAMRHVDGKLMKSSSSKVKCHTFNEKKKLAGKKKKVMFLCNNFLPNSPHINQKQGMPKTKVTKESFREVPLESNCPNLKKCVIKYLCERPVGSAYDRLISSVPDHKLIRCSNNCGFVASKIDNIIYHRKNCNVDFNKSICNMEARQPTQGETSKESSIIDWHSSEGVACDSSTRKVNRTISSTSYTSTPMETFSNEQGKRKTVSSTLGSSYPKHLNKSKKKKISDHRSVHEKSCSSIGSKKDKNITAYKQSLDDNIDKNLEKSPSRANASVFNVAQHNTMDVIEMFKSEIQSITRKMNNVLESSKLPIDASLPYIDHQNTSTNPNQFSNPHVCSKVKVVSMDVIVCDCDNPNSSSNSTTKLPSLKAEDNNFTSKVLPKSIKDPQEMESFESALNTFRQTAEKLNLKYGKK